MPAPNDRGRAWSAALAAALLLEWAFLAWASRGVTIDYPHGFIALLDILATTGLRRGLAVDLWRPPLPWVIITPVVAAAYRLGGPGAALRAAHAVMPGFLALSAWVSYRAYRTRYRLSTSLAAAVLLAANPLALAFSPFLLFDVFSMLDGTAFLLASVSFAEKPTRRRWAVLLACYCVSLLSRYHLAILALVPVACVFAAPRPWSAAAGARAVVRTWVWALPLAACLIVGGLYLALGRLVPGFPDLRFMVKTALVHASRRESWWSAVYARSLWRQLGPALLVPAAWGVCRWLRGGVRERSLALGLLVPLALLSTVVDFRDQRYALFLLPLLYGALAEGLEAAVAPRWAPAVALAALALAPWSESRASIAALEREPALRPACYERVGAEVAAAFDRGECVELRRGQVVSLPTLDWIARESPMLIISDEALDYYLPDRPELRGFGGDWATCSKGLVVLPRLEGYDWPAPARWEGDDLVRGYLKSADGRYRLAWSATAAGLRPASGGRLAALP